LSAGSGKEKSLALRTPGLSKQISSEVPAGQTCYTEKEAHAKKKAIHPQMNGKTMLIQRQSSKTLLTVAKDIRSCKKTFTAGLGKRNDLKDY